MSEIYIKVGLKPSQMQAVDDIRGQVPRDQFLSLVFDKALCGVKRLANETQEDNIDRALTTATGFFQNAVSIYTSIVVDLGNAPVTIENAPHEEHRHAKYKDADDGKPKDKA